MLKILTLIPAIALLAWFEPCSTNPSAKQNVDPITVDGPYVLYRGDSIIVNYIDSANGMLSVRSHSYPISQKDQVQLVVNTDQPGKTFNVKLHPTLTKEKNDYGKAKKILVLSDIEGEFAAFRSLLQGSGVIDSDYKWIYGDGQIALVGDFVDRGTMVTEVLWLIYSLETQAAAAGGKVHYILGNHEVMNMSNDLHYVHPRYMTHAGLMNLHYLQLFGQQAEMGRWFATKNITERIGNLLLAHGGFSPLINESQLSLNIINDSARIYYNDTSSKFPTPHAEALLGDEGPLWYRGYYHGKERATDEQVDKTLNIYNTRYIITGHTSIAREIISLFNGKVIDTDVPHHQGFSEALLIEGNKMYRVNASGEKMPITDRH